MKNEINYLEAIEQSQSMQISQIGPRNLRGGALGVYLKTLPPFSEIQKEALVGLLLGDGNLGGVGVGLGSAKRRGITPNFKFDQGVQATEYVWFIYLLFSDYVGLAPTMRRKENKDHSLWFRTYRLPALQFYHQEFYTTDALGAKIRRVPALIHRYLKPRGLALWFMDDGSKNTSSGGYYLHTESFTLPEQKVLIQALGKNFGLNVEMHRSAQGLQGATALRQMYYKLYIPRADRQKLHDLILPYYHPVMKYKLYL
jgi:hypothetical protein